jgi:(4S)-4-hydroxy-5-phosphonooxypentane-2,3-dione isomerase
MSFEPDKVKQFLSIFEQSKSLIRNFKGCVHLELLNDADHPNIFFTYSIWESQAELDKYRDSDLFGNVWPKTKTLFNAKPEAWSLNRHTIIK